MKRILPIITVVFILLSCNPLQAQWATGGNGPGPGQTWSGMSGGGTGYYKNHLGQFAVKGYMRRTCNGYYYDNFPGTKFTFDTISHDQGPFWPWVIRMNNIDSSMQWGDAKITTINHDMVLTEKNCNTCFAYSNPFLPLKYLNEWASAGHNYNANINSTHWSIPTTENSFTIFQGMMDLFNDSLAIVSNNIQWQANINPYVSGNFAHLTLAYYYSRVYRWQDYNNINSPDFTNRAAIIAVKGQPYTWNPGIADKDNDSINVRPLLIKLRTSSFHPHNPPANLNTPFLTAAQVNMVKKAMTDSVVDVQYKPGFSPANPFGPGSGYTLDASTGEISFTPQDTGYYVLAYRVEEYRDGQLLGDVMNIRLAMVIDSNAALTDLAGPDNVTGGSYNAATKTMTICPNQPLSFTMKATSPLSDAMIVMTDNMQSQIPASSVIYNGQNTDSVTLTFNWTPTVADIGYHYIYADAVDTACGPNHLPAHQSTGFKIYVPGFTGVRHPDTTICPGAPVTLTGSFGGPYQWAVLPGGDPTLPCTTCNSITVTPNKNTTYTFTGTGPICYRQDTVTVKLLPDFTVHAGVDSLFCNGVPNGYTPGASVTPSGNYYTYLWSPAAGLSNPNILNPNLINPGLNKTYILTVSDNLGCYTHSDTVALSSITWTTSLTPLADTFCPGDSVQLLATGGQQYTWAPSAGLSCDTCPDPVVRPVGNVTYTVVITDTASGCKQQHSAVLTQSDIRQRVNAGGNIDAPGGAFQLNGYAPGTFYWSPGKYLEDSTKARTKGQISENTMFVLTANEGGCTATDTITVFMLRCQKIILPNVFSPNGDGRNDRFIFNNTEPLEVLEFSIYNRWGAKVYSETGTSIEGWDGTYKGSPAPTEVYVYRLRLRCDGKEEILQGNVTLLR